MTTPEKTNITVQTIVNAPVEKVWDLWTDPKHITQWNNASDDWYTPHAETDLRVGGKFLWRMEARDGSIGFDFTGTFSKVDPCKQLDYTMDDDRKAWISFASNANETTVTETFEAEQTNTLELQQTGWQAILDNFKKYAESSGNSDVLHFEININAQTEKVYRTMLDEKQYEEWTSVFNPTSHFKGSWEKGSKILFLGTDQEGNRGGMVSRIRENIPNRFVSIEHLGIVHGDQELLSGPEVEGWAGAMENYTFNGEQEKTLLLVDMESPQKFNAEFKSYFLDTWPKALDKLKGLCEQ